LCLFIRQKFVLLLVGEANLMFRVPFKPLFLETIPKGDIIFVPLIDLIILRDKCPKKFSLVLASPLSTRHSRKQKISIIYR
jgi:hypothetical protein